ncbi:MAG TPA: hypothetical protein VHJ76_06805 [Actinomycetota bacterium]|nr:hypothetical protein [Actinomycetota bacterium]
MTRSWTSTSAAALTALLLTAAACSDPQGTAPGDSSTGRDEQQQQGKGGEARSKGRAAKPPGGGSGGATPPVGGAPDVAVPTPGAGAKPGLSGASKTETNVSSQGADPRNATVLITEPDPDAEKTGVTPDYADILSAKVKGTNADVRFTITFRGTLPQKMPDDKTFMVAGIGLTAPKGRQQGYAFGASADHTGWKAYGGGKEGRDYPGEMTVSGATVVFTIPWSAVKGPRAFEWYAQGSWFKSLAGTTHYSLDALPNDGPAKYPAG